MTKWRRGPGWSLLTMDNDSKSSSKHCDPSDYVATGSRVSERRVSERTKKLYTKHIHKYEPEVQHEGGVLKDPRTIKHSCLLYETSRTGSPATSTRWKCIYPQQHSTLNYSQLWSDFQKNQTTTLEPKDRRKRECPWIYKWNGGDVTKVSK